MALTPRDMPITREDVYGWIEAWNNSGKTETLEEWIRRHVKELRLEDDMVNTSGSEYGDDETHIADLIVDDLPSYPNYDAPSS
jgi:hypothetical protein